MPRLLWRLAGLVTALLATAALYRSATWPFAGGAPRGAVLRQSWSARPERVERCQRLSDSALAALPPHMRLRTQCEGAFARYLMALDVNGRELVRDTLRGGGLRHDRPMHVFREDAVRPGTARVRLTVSRIDSGSVRDTTGTGARDAADTLLGGRAAREDDERLRRNAESLPPHLVLDTLVQLTEGRVVLIVFDETRRRFVVRTGS